MPPAIQKKMAMEEVKMLVVPKALRRDIFDNDISDKLVSDEMAERFLEIAPPVFSLIIPDYQTIAERIEPSYVTGDDFAALSASCVVIERLLNKARIDLHEHHKDKAVKKLWNKGPTDDWPSNIKALKKWGYLDDTFASELTYIYKEIRCRYLHSREIKDMRRDALMAITAAYKLMKIFIGFPEDLFSWTNGSPVCKNEADPKFLAFYKPHLETKSEIMAQTQTETKIRELWNKYVKSLNECKYDEACVICSEIDKLKPRDYLVFNNWGSALNLLAKLRSDEKLFEQACQKFEQAIQFVNIEPEKYGVHCNWGVALAEWAKLNGNEALFEQANQKFKQAENINQNIPEVYDNWAGIFIHWSKLKIGTSQYESLLNQAEEKGLKAESLRKGSSAYRLAKIYALRNDKEKCKIWLLSGQEAGTLVTREQAMKDSDLDSVRGEAWLKEIKWKGEK
ncbi:MAG: hypothetical protein ABSE89_00915 [Sedimentisphaerales bacterium]